MPARQCDLAVEVAASMSGLCQYQTTLKHEGVLPDIFELWGVQACPGLVDHA